MLNRVWLLTATMGLMFSGGCVAQQADVVRMKHDFEDKISRLGQSRSELERAVADAQASLKQARSVMTQQQEEIRQLSQAQRTLHDQAGLLRDDEVAPLRGEVEQALHSLASFRSEIEGLQSFAHTLQDQLQSQHQEWKLAMSDFTEKLHRQQTEQANQLQSEALTKASFKEFKVVLESLREQMALQASQVNQLEARLQQASQTVTSNASQTSAYLAEVQGSVASLASSLKETHRALLVRLDQQEQRMSELASKSQTLSVRNVEGAVSSRDLQGLLSTVTQLRETIGLVARQLGNRVDAHEEELATLGRRQVVGPSVTVDPVLPVVQDYPSINVSNARSALPSPNSKQEISPKQQEFYQSAFQLLQGRQNDLALAKFSEFLRQYPASPLAANAQYWKGECYYSSQQYDAAIHEFELVLKLYPSDEKAPAALLKIGYSHLALEKPVLARSSFRELVRRFPQSAEALKAYARLTEVSRIADRTS